jgi:hydroxyacylglutathione hydrolase
VLIRTVVSPLLGTNCYLLADDARRCLVVDPGAGVVEQLAVLVQDQRLEPVAVLVTHGHVDHTWSAGALGELWQVPVHVHQDDAYRLEDPFGTLGPLGGQLAQMATPLGAGYRRPDRVVTFSDAVEVLDADGSPFAVEALHAQGHTEGSTVYRVHGADGPVALTGDVLFAGTIGRTDLPGGDPQAMARSLTRLADLDPVTRVLPGHGPESTIAAELTTNPYLRSR